ncbi:tripartite tricarboxylate transporter TctB family protein [soil metagenome]
MTTVPVSTVRGRLAGRSELGVALLLGVVGVGVLVDALGIDAPTTDSDRVGPQAFPLGVAVLLLLCAVCLAVDVLRGGHGEAEEGEDVDLTAATEWGVVVPLLVVFMANVLLVDVLGWVVSGALLFFGCTWALGSRHYVRDPAISLAMSLVTFYGFYLGLGIHLPAGILEGVL